MSTIYFLILSILTIILMWVADEKQSNFYWICFFICWISVILILLADIFILGLE